jgi:hypothetical protein
VQVHDADEVLFLVLPVDPLLDRPEVVPEVQATAGLDTGENALLAHVARNIPHVIAEGVKS